MSAMLRRVPRAFLLGLALVGALAAPQGLVLCVSSGDHVAIEPAIELVPCGAPAASFADEFGAPVPESCTDFALLQASIRASAGAEFQAPLPVWTSFTAPSPRVAATLPARGGYASRGLSASLRAQRTVVLIV